LKGKLSALLRLIYPEHCAFCGDIISDVDEVCSSCRESVYLIGDEVCGVCGRDVGKCGCGLNDFYFDRCIAPFYYLDSVQEGILRFKFANCPEVGDVFAKLVYDRIHELYGHLSFDAVTCVPMHPVSFRKRGYNQGEILALAIEKWIHIRFFHYLEKASHHVPQHEIKGNRFENVKDTFTFIEGSQVAEKTILIVDDVFTSGATLSECARILKKNGAECVYCAAIAATDII